MEYCAEGTLLDYVATGVPLPFDVLLCSLYQVTPEGPIPTSKKASQTSNASHVCTLAQIMSAVRYVHNSGIWAGCAAGEIRKSDQDRDPHTSLQKDSGDPPQPGSADPPGIDHKLAHQLPSRPLLVGAAKSPQHKSPPLGRRVTPRRSACRTHRSRDREERVKKDKERGRSPWKG